MSARTDIVGYTYSADTYCPTCVVAQVTGRDWCGVCGDTEANLAHVAQALGIDHEEESSFDSGDFPKVIFREQAVDYAYHAMPADNPDGGDFQPAHCGACHRALIEDNR